jgi:hypothetical protein
MLFVPSQSKLFMTKPKRRAKRKGFGGRNFARPPKFLAEFLPAPRLAKIAQDFRQNKFGFCPKGTAMSKAFSHLVFLALQGRKTFLEKVAKPVSFPSPKIVDRP